MNQIKALMRGILLSVVVAIFMAWWFIQLMFILLHSGMERIKKCIESDK